MSSLDLAPRTTLLGLSAPAPVRGQGASSAGGPSPTPARVRVHGKFFRLGQEKWFVKGLTYGPFRPNSEGEYLPERTDMARDFAQIRHLGANTIRLYHVPPRWLLDEALQHNLRVFIDVPWEKHRCFFEDWSATQDARDTVRKTVRLLGRHPATFAISVANEIPKDVVRYYGHRRVERFIDELLDVVKQESPDCLATYTNYPSTEFLTPHHRDFHCFNVYLEDEQKLARYLDRLQHLAGPLPLILGEFGIDTHRHGQLAQASALESHVRQVFRHGLAGSYVFSYTDDWFTGGHQIEDWAFGITTTHRTPKISAQSLQLIWSQVPNVIDPASTVDSSSSVPHPSSLPRVSIVVCSYNGARTLDECLSSLKNLSYPDYEVILVDDGSTDNTAEIAIRHPHVKYIRQENQGLSVARNVGAHASTGKIVAYTDSDCVADEHWLHYLVQSMLDQKVDAIGGPNIPPATDGVTAQCVAASPGGPSHVMLDDHQAEHVPGCNMAFWRDRLLAIGGFDPQFRVAGDDVDICWRFMDAGLSIGYAPSALVWHHRRNTVRAYFKQQAGYGRSEAMLHVKHPHRFNQLGCARWKGIIYGEGAVALPVVDPLIHHGRFGAALFQQIYHRNEYSAWSYPVLLEWHAIALFTLLLAALYPPLAIISIGMWIFTLVATLRSSLSVKLPKKGIAWTRPLVFCLHLAQPVIRSWHRYKHRLSRKKLPHVPADTRLSPSHIRRVSWRRSDLYWTSDANRGREELLHALQEEVHRPGFEANFHNDWTTWDALITGDLWHNIYLYTATEELGYPSKFTRARCVLKPTTFLSVVSGAVAIIAATALLSGNYISAAIASALGLGFLLLLHRSRSRCLNAVSRLLWRAGHHAKLENVTVSAADELLDRAPAPAPSNAIPEYAS